MANSSTQVAHDIIKNDLFASPQVTSLQMRKQNSSIS